MLFIDEAYRLSNTHHFGQDAIDKIVTCLTEDKFKNHLVVIFAGYEDHIKRLLNTNPGLHSRVPGRLHFPPFTKGDATDLLYKHLNKDGFAYLRGSPKVDRAMTSLVGLSNWANGRSVQNLSRDIKNAALSLPEGSRTPCLISEEIVLENMENMRQMLVRQLPEPGKRSPPSQPESTAPSPPPAATDMLNDSEPIQQTRENSPPLAENEDGPDTTTNTTTNTTTTGRRSERLKRKLEETSSDKSSSTTETNKRRQILGSGTSSAARETDRQGIERQGKAQPEAWQRQKGTPGREVVDRVLDRMQEKAEAEGKGKNRSVCRQGYAWLNEGNGLFRCAGGSHTIRLPQ